MTQPLTDCTAPTTVLIIDDCIANRAGLRLVLETEPGVHVVAEASTIGEGLRLIESHKPSVVVLDLELAAPDASAVVRELASRHPACAVLLIALFFDPTTHSELLAAGAAACIEKDLPQNFLKTFRTVRRQSSYPG
jgi:DNA-binding NarL/FixJ family response regulator